MNILKYSVNFASFCVVACIIASTSAVIAQPRPSQSNSVIKLTPTQLKVLRSLGLKIALPSYLPANFHADKVLVEAGRENVQSLRYLVVYQNSSADKCFAIESTSGGIGDLPSGSRSYPINSPIFGKSVLEQGLYGNAKQPTLLSQWLGSQNGPFYRFVGTGVLPELSNCSNVTPQEAVKISQSVRYFN
ncbi:hypothetical protein [Nostoc sp. ATCC 53789]|uniref:hypothetical protein n=1 Tax=Nostoc sp. ATCC 53789 TaxID=76335 RepID=UPI000DED2495|nr:hypothetical protein [Nostoc sp. ATCC 53789]MBD2507764.1 hypothetical protein [Desmonostoc muscorum FACHB-395]QHG19004.1 hypothetical protein GJB62_25600 [Nostoc sp. ATCC 53789]RCJ18884.1 hypothetical protein A6V25_07105 [Nostoc sp. ATCC 53789]